MRIRASLAAAALSGAAALTALAVPAAHAGENPAAAKAEQYKSAHQALSKHRSLAATPATGTEGDIQVTKVTVNANKDFVVGVSPKSFNVYVTVTDPSGIYQDPHGVDVACGTAPTSTTTSTDSSGTRTAPRAATTGAPPPPRASSPSRRSRARPVTCTTAR